MGASPAKFAWVSQERPIVSRAGTCGKPSQCVYQHQGMVLFVSSALAAWHVKVCRVRGTGSTDGESELYRVPCLAVLAI